MGQIPIETYHTIFLTVPNFQTLLSEVDHTWLSCVTKYINSRFIGCISHESNMVKEIDVSQKRAQLFNTEVSDTPK